MSVKINVGGTIFETTEITLKKINYLKYIIDDTNINLNNEILFVNRSSHIFKHVLALAIDDNYKYPSKYKTELNFYDMCSNTTKQLNDNTKEFKLFFDELTICFDSMTEYQFIYIDGSHYPMPKEPIKEIKDYEKFCMKINENLIKITSLINENLKYLDKICVMFNPVIVTKNFESLYGNGGYHGWTLFAQGLNYIPYNMYQVFSMQLVDIDEYNKKYQSNNININNYIIDISKMGVNSSLNINKFTGNYAEHCEYTKYCIPVNIMIPASMPKSQSSPPICSKYNIFSNIKFIDMILLKKRIDNLNTHKNKFL